MNQNRKIFSVTPPTDKRWRQSRFSVIILCYACSMLLGLLLICGAPMASLFLLAHGGEELQGLAGSYSAVLLQQKEIARMTENLPGEYHFNPSLLQQEVNAASLARFSQATMGYWYGIAHGVSDPNPPAWDVAPFAKALQEDTGFMARWEAEGTEQMALEAAQKLGTVIGSVVFPLQQAPIRLGLGLLASQGFLDKILYTLGALFLVEALLLLAIRRLQSNRPYQSLWFYGSGLLTAFTGVLIILLKMKGLPLETLLSKYSSVLVYFGSAIITRYETLLRFFGMAYALGCVGLLILFWRLRYRWMRNNHHELFSFF